MDNALPTIEELLPYLPHRPPMIWIDELHQITSNGGSCLVHLKKESHYMDDSGPRSTSAIEWMAQAYGYICAARSHQQNPQSIITPSKAFLVQIRDASFIEPLPESGTLLIELQEKRSLGALSLVTGRVKEYSTGKTLIEAELKLFAE